ncbi:MAG: CRISPR-associated endonuclease Cas2 [Candidatus Sungbacteria bacterium]|uniref:CRISPR-associated endonuclease Cas2 n=1 Tax=Candidatus Sungiibacteriota bacterium TaxID=2750080 RepID=A0A932YV68_9BACT|nr:CRISPR-associated endonuclease Cas2 [Candidatus Sungbacteria bacterium]
MRKLTKAILLIIAAGTITAAALMAPNTLQIFRPFIRSTRRSSSDERDRIRRALARLRARRLVSVEWKGDEALLRITAGGRHTLRRIEFEALMIARPTRWDGKWRIVAFDIPEKQVKARQALRWKLEQLGFLRMQRSVFVYPYPCRDEIDFLKNFFHIEPFVQCFETSDLDHREGSIRKHYGLLKY